ncbi:MAG: hypothetical protein KQI35_04995 [Bacteroidetes bacterium]|nr:hypothetical protein [Bacteroidota bacterium]
MRQILKKILRLFIILLVFAIAGVGGLWIVSKYFGNDIKESLVNELNQHIAVKVSVDDIDFSVFENFPYASVKFSNVSTVEDDQSEKTPLIRASEVSALFNLYDLITKNYSIDRIILKDGFLNLIIHQDGQRNFDVFKKREGNEVNDFNINLKHVILKNIGVSYIHYPSDQEYLFAIHQGRLTGQFSRNLHDIGFEGDVYSTHIRSGKTTLLTDRELSLIIHLENQESQNVVLIKKAHLTTDEMSFDLNGKIHTEGKNRSISLNITANRSPLESFIKLVPPEYLAPVSEYELQGNLDFHATIEGTFSGDLLPEVNINFNFSDGKIAHPASGFYLNHVSFGGIFNNGPQRTEASYSTELNQIQATIRGGMVSGKVQISNFQQPLVQADLSANMDLKELLNIYNIPQLESISGNLEVDMQFTNRLKSFRKFTVDDFISSRTAGDMKFTNMDFTLKNNNLSFHEFNGSFRFSNKDLIIDTFTGKVSNSDFNMDGYFGNILAYTFMEEEPVYISAEIQSQNINLDQLLAYSSQTSDSPYQLNFSPKVSFDLQVDIDHFTFRKFDGQRLTGKFSMANQKFYVRNGSLKAMDGNIALSGLLNGTDPEIYRIDCDARFMDVDIQQLFREFGNFGQENLTSDHLRGRVTADVQYKSTLTPALYVDPASVFTFAEITINNGELIQYTPLYALSRYIKREELEHVRFSTLTNNIKIENRIIYIPQMEIRSSTMDISLYGEHTFDNITDYHLQLYLDELLSNNKQQKSEEEIEGIFVQEDENGRTKLFLSMKGPADDPDISYDTREVRKKIASDLSREKEEFKEVIRKEFNWLSKNQPSNIDQESAIAPDNAGSQFAIGWDEIKKDSITPISKPPVTSDKSQKAHQEQKKDFIILWDEKKDTIH